MNIGEFIALDGWRIWVEHDWLDVNYPTLLEKAKQIKKSGWIKDNLKGGTLWT